MRLRVGSPWFTSAVFGLAIVVVGIATDPYRSGPLLWPAMIVSRLMPPHTVMTMRASGEIARLAVIFGAGVIVWATAYAAIHLWHRTRGT